MMLFLDSIRVYWFICYSEKVVSVKFIVSSRCMLMWLISLFMMSMVIIVFRLFGVVIRFVMVVG